MLDKHDHFLNLSSNSLQMLRTISFLLLFTLANLATAQIRFACEIENLPEDFILVQKPVQGNYFPQVPEKIMQGKKGRFLIETADDTPGFLTIHLGQGRDVRIFMEPGRTSMMEVDMTDFARSLKFSGPTADQNDFLQGLDRTALLPVDGSLAERSVNLDEKPKDGYLSMVDHIEAERKVLDRRGKRFSDAFSQAVEQDIVFYHACVFTEKIAKDYDLYRLGRQARFNPKWAEYWGKAYQMTNFAEENGGVSEYFLRTLDHYLGTYRLGYRQENEYIDPDLSIGEQFLEYDRLLSNELQGQQLEYALAGVLSLRALKGKNEPVLFDLFQKYQNDFPHSPYLENFRQTASPIGIALEKMEVALPPGMIDLTSENVQSLDDLLGRFPGKVIYMDVWASWCSPCLFEFRLNDPLERFAEGKDIVLLFISVDDEDRREQWTKIIKDNNLKGYHLMADFSLRDELINTFGDGSNLALPHYIIYDKKGKLVDRNAKQPSHNSLLFSELQRYLD